MKTAVRYYTRSGNTRRLAEAIAKTAGVPAKDVSVPLTEKVDILFLGSSVYAAGIDGAVKRFIEENREKIGTIVNFSTAALLTSTYSQVRKVAEANGVTMSVKEFHCRGSFTVLHRGRPNQEDIRAAETFAAQVLNRV